MMQISTLTGHIMIWTWWIVLQNDAVTRQNHFTFHNNCWFFNFEPRNRNPIFCLSSLRSLAVFRQVERAKKAGKPQSQTPRPRGTWERDNRETSSLALKKQLKPPSYASYYLSNSEFEFERTHEKSLTTRLEFILLFLLIAIYIVEQFEYIECERRLKTHYTTWHTYVL